MAKERYEKPVVFDLTSGINEANAADCLSGTSATGGNDDCGTGFAAGKQCHTGNSPTQQCSTGINPGAGPSTCKSGATATGPQCKSGGFATAQCKSGGVA